MIYLTIIIYMLLYQVDILFRMYTKIMTLVSYDIKKSTVQLKKISYLIMIKKIIDLVYKLRYFEF